jgi:tRNA threonylcarbamoyladenosine biosynthesis protein TsaE
MTIQLGTWTSLTQDATRRLADDFARHLKPGDVLLLEGQIGAGKSTFARALIQSRLGRAEDVPSPTFTIVQTYPDGAGDIWHCDLYRLTSPEEAWELGLDDAFENAICLIEWPDRLGQDCPAKALTLTFSAGDSTHSVVACGSHDWAQRLEAFNG